LLLLSLETLDMGEGLFHSHYQPRRGWNSH
jgi:hypothetical protein